MTNEVYGSKLALALSKAQGEMKSAKKDVTNPFFKSKYADLASVWDACREALSKNEIAVIQVPELKDGIIGIRTKLVHSSGEFEEGFFPLAVPVTAKAQEMGSAMTYLRRYALSAMVGVAPEDDDGNEATKTSGQPNNQHILAKKANEFAEALEIAPTSELFEKCVKDNAVLMSELAKECPDRHERAKKYIEKKRASFIEDKNA